MSEAPNADQIRYWNGAAGPAWARHQALMDAQLEPLTRPAIAAAAVARGERVIDLGCGCGATSLMLAAEGARVTGIDVSAPMLEVARARGQALAASADISFVQADASTHAFEPMSADLAFSRFGVMFFDDPPAAFANIRGALRPGGRACLLVWRSGAENPWMTLPMAAALAHLPPPTPPAPRAPGPFAFAEAAYVTDILERAGFEAIALEPLDLPMIVGGGGADGAARFYLEIGPLQRLLADADERVRARVERDVIATLEAHVVDDSVRLPAACWIIHARNPPDAGAHSA